jgi:glycosyltransferase involved in cell wall biosynthesis
VPIVAIDARDAFDPQLRGWGRYVRELVDALPERPGLDYHVISRGGRGPELFFEQFELPVRLRREQADLVHAPNCFLPLARPCMGVVTIHDLAFEVFPDDFSRRTGWMSRTFARRGARSAQRVICVSGYTGADVVRRYGVDEARVRIIPNAPSLPIGDEPVPDDGPYLLAVGDLRPKKNLLRLVEAFRLLRAEGLEHRLVLAGVDSGAQAERVHAAAGGEPVQLTGYLSDVRLDAAPTRSCTRRCTRASGSCSSRRWRAACRSSPPARRRCPRPAATRRSTSIRSTPVTWRTRSGRSSETASATTSSGGSASPAHRGCRGPTARR